MEDIGPFLLLPTKTVCDIPQQTSLFVANDNVIVTLKFADFVLLDSFLTTKILRSVKFHSSGRGNFSDIQNVKYTSPVIPI